MHQNCLLSSSPHNSYMFGWEMRCLQTSRKGCFVWIVPVDQTDFWDAKRWSWEEAGSPAPAKLSVPVPLAERGPNHTSYACFSASNCLPAALHRHIHASSSVLLESSEDRGGGCTAGPFSLPAQGQGLTDKVPTSYLHEFPHVLLQAKPITRIMMKISV